jgi:hypothetical protein
MDIAIKIEQPDFAFSEVRDAISHALTSETEQARMKRDYFAGICRDFERRFALSSDEFMEKFDRGELGDDAYAFDWYAAKRGLDLWERRLQILSKASV